jgi:hypothetical protein
MAWTKLLSLSAVECAGEQGWHVCSVGFVGKLHALLKATRWEVSHNGLTLCANSDGMRVKPNVCVRRRLICDRKLIGVAILFLLAREVRSLGYSADISGMGTSSGAQPWRETSSKMYRTCVSAQPNKHRPDEFFFLHRSMTLCLV